MRKTLLLGLLLLAFGFGQVQAQAPCTPNQFVALLGIPGIYPNPLQNPDLPDGQQGQQYGETFTFVVPGDTTIDLSALTGTPGLPVVTAEVVGQNVSNVTGMPNGMSYACDYAGCSFPGDSLGCLRIEGTPTESGTFTVGIVSEIVIQVPAGVPVLGGQQLGVPIPGVNYNWVVTSGVGIEELNMDRFSVAQNGPNPFSGSTTIYFHSPKPAQVGLEVFDLTGRKLHSSEHRAHPGTNGIEFDAQGLAPGTYLYTVSNGSESVTHKMIVAE